MATIAPLAPPPAAAIAGLFGAFRAVPRTPTPPSRTTGAALALAPVRRLKRALTFAMARQQQTNWCWAAVSTSVAAFFKPQGVPTQCKLAANQLGVANCCGGGAGAGTACNQPWYLDAALEHLGRLARMADSAQALTAFQREIDGGRPLCARIGWSGGGGHFVALSAWRIDAAGTAYVTVEDPWFGESEIAFDLFRTAYRGTGAWTHSYFVSATARGGLGGNALAPRVRDPLSIGG